MLPLLPRRLRRLVVVAQVVAVVARLPGRMVVVEGRAAALQRRVGAQLLKDEAAEAEAVAQRRPLQPRNSRTGFT